MTRWTLSEVMAQALKPPVADPEQAKFNQKLVDKLKYCKEVLASIRNASANQASEDGNTNTNLGVEGMVPSVSSKPSKVALR
jgi:cell cycle serine/threonine-protein kinase CDC5/MSD2